MLISSSSLMLLTFNAPFILRYIISTYSGLIRCLFMGEISDWDFFDYFFTITVKSICLFMCSSRWVCCIMAERTSWDIKLKAYLRSKPNKFGECGFAQQWLLLLVWGWSEIWATSGQWGVQNSINTTIVILSLLASLRL